MDNLVRLEIAKADIFSAFDQLGSKAFRRSDIEELFHQQRDFWRLTTRASAKQLIDFLIETGRLAEHRFKFPSRSEVRFSWTDASDMEIVQTLRPNGYFSHFTAMYTHGLTLQIPKTIYLNVEQSPKRNRQKELAQDRIDLAFQRPCRQSRTVAAFRDQRVCLLSGMHTDMRGTVEDPSGVGEKIRITGVERTLIDIAVRPVYAGGVHQALEAYRKASDVVSVNTLVAMLGSMDYAYPYHQVIGFYLEKSGTYKNIQIDLVDRIPKIHDFYLTHNMSDPEYSKRWRLHYPRGM
jgi:predicted transcriptional regulator of viral defense system